MHLKFWHLPCVLATLASFAAAQHVVSFRSGLIHYVEGRVTLDGSPVSVKPGDFPRMRDSSVLETTLGRAEVLLTPGTFARLSEHGQLVLVAGDITDTRLRLESGSAMLEVAELERQNAVAVQVGGVWVKLQKRGLYRFDAAPPRVLVYDGEITAAGEPKPLKAGKGREVSLDGSQLVARFDTETGDALYRWSARRSRYVSMANLAAARTIRDSGLRWSRAGWEWNAYLAMFTFVPAGDMVRSPFGTAFYSPRTVGYAFQRRFSINPGGGGAGQPDPNRAAYPVGSQPPSASGASGVMSTPSEGPASGGGETRRTDVTPTPQENTVVTIR